MPIQWRNELSIDKGFIDRDHKQLIDIVNRFEREIESNDSKSTLMHVLANLKHYVHDHFRREESFQNEIHYPLKAAHAVEHRELECRLEAAISHFREAVERGNYKVVAKEVAGLLRDWLVDHIIKSDLKLKDHISVTRTP